MSATSRAGNPLEPTAKRGHSVASHDDDIGSLREHPVREMKVGNGAVVVRLAGELDVFNAGVVREALVDATGQQAERVVVDLGAVAFVDSTMLGVLVDARTRLPNRRAFLLAAPGVEVRRALEVSGLDRHFEVHDTVDSALAAKPA
jgi:anti-sigma B factor antagonist